MHSSAYRNRLLLRRSVSISFFLEFWMFQCNFYFPRCHFVINNRHFASPDMKRALWSHSCYAIANGWNVWQPARSEINLAQCRESDFQLKCNIVGEVSQMLCHGAVAHCSKESPIWLYLIVRAQDTVRGGKDVQTVTWPRHSEGSSVQMSVFSNRRKKYRKDVVISVALSFKPALSTTCV